MIDGHRHAAVGRRGLQPAAQVGWQLGIGARRQDTGQVGQRQPRARRIGQQPCGTLEGAPQPLAIAGYAAAFSRRRSSAAS
ncbi:MAG: hypothetical protein MSC31_06395 [Solirubrobacteraceae bacterium MAG38_C4-C5]|nr:hypothetical protein [Candidatus Siliceabacter maunaloa]